jgi:hypothetical protein
LEEESLPEQAPKSSPNAKKAKILFI